METLFDLDLNLLGGVGEKTKKLFEKLGVPSLGALFYYFPKNYEDWGNVRKLSEIGFQNDDSCVGVKIIEGVKTIKLGAKRTLYKATGSDGSGLLDIVFFNNKYVVDSLYPGNEVVLYGKIIKNFNKYEVVCPKMCLKGKEPQYLKPIYGQTKGLYSWKIESTVKSAFKLFQGKISESLPEKILKENNLCSLEFALKNIHFPKNKESLSLARKRLVFEEVFTWQMGMKFLKKNMSAETQIKIKKDFSREFYFALPFLPTNAQKKAISECIKDMSEGGRCMNRLLQGDVGSGKTVVAGALAYSIIKNGYQAAIMAPTEILANQHFETFKKLFFGMPVSVGFLTGAMKQKTQKQIKEETKEGKINLLVGTHSLISENLEFKNLGLVITDEQHRFGVEQRSKLVGKGKNPHVLVMSATPIPRSLSLIIYGDMDVSVLDELPPGRQAVDTFVIDSSKKERMYGFLKKLLSGKGQGYIVCPCVDESEIYGLFDVNGYKKDLVENHGFSKYNLEVLHGKMSFAQKEKIMADFLNGKIDLLISTTVIEVGIDVKNACFMVVENAERFGLSQLHQLRGRVGRGKNKSYCILVSDSKSEESFKRLKIMATSNSGFYLAGEDLKIRGPGEVLGLRQHGSINFKLVNIIDDIAVVKKISQIAKEVFENWQVLPLEDKSMIQKKLKNFFNSGVQENVVI